MIETVIQDYQKENIPNEKETAKYPRKIGRAFLNPLAIAFLFSIFILTRPLPSWEYSIIGQMYPYTILFEVIRVN
ncbi:MAG: hypothetical protein HUK23_04475 [Sphaerochaetaceae bacterium]|nr:hypothetical protein [Sphaerochaetaceae bacterium]